MPERIIHRDVVEASELGLPPGSWPNEISFMGTGWHKLYEQTTADNEIISVTYICNENSYELLEVLND